MTRREEIAAELARHAPNLGPRDPSRPGVWFQWCACGWDGGEYRQNHGGWYREHLADALLAGPLAALLAERDVANDFRHDMAQQAYCAPDSDWDTIRDSLTARIAALLAERDDLAAKVAALLDVLDRINVGYVPSALRAAMQDARRALGDPS